MIFFCCCGRGKNQSTSWSSKSFMGCRCHNIRIGNRARVHTRSNESRNMRHIHKENCANLVRNLSKLFKINDSWVSRSTGNNHFRFIFLRNTKNLIIVQESLFSYAIGHNIVKQSRKVNGGTMGQVSTGIQAHAHNGISRLADRHGYRHIGLCTGVGLHIGIFSTEELFCSFNGKSLYLINLLTASIIALSRIAFRILVCKNCSHGNH